MKKLYSKREREHRRNLRIFVIVLLIFIVLVSSLIYYDSTHPKDTPRYTAEELLHDHDGDGIPDH